jgi:hypothetical protein
VLISFNAARPQTTVTSQRPEGSYKAAADLLSAQQPSLDSFTPGLQFGLGGKRLDRYATTRLSAVDLAIAGYQGNGKDGSKINTQEMVSKALSSGEPALLLEQLLYSVHDYEDQTESPKEPGIPQGRIDVLDKLLLQGETHPDGMALLLDALRIKTLPPGARGGGDTKPIPATYERKILDLILDKAEGPHEDKFEMPSQVLEALQRVDYSEGQRQRALNIILHEAEELHEFGIITSALALPPEYNPLFKQERQQLVIDRQADERLRETAVRIIEQVGARDLRLLDQYLKLYLAALQRPEAEAYSSATREAWDEAFNRFLPPNRTAILSR